MTGCSTKFEFCRLKTIDFVTSISRYLKMVIVLKKFINFMEFSLTLAHYWQIEFLVSKVLKDL